jgi:anti-sigma factor RsiW
MRPCSRNRKIIALLAANALDAPTAGELRQHITICPGCREYFSEISDLASRLSQPQEAPEIEASERFHQKLAGRIRSAETQSLAAYFAGVLLKSRILIPLAGVFLVVGIIAARFHSQTHIHNPSTNSSPGIAAATVAGDISPTFANYQNAANKSLDELDSLLTRQSREGIPTAQVYTASATALAQGSL